MKKKCAILVFLFLLFLLPAQTAEAIIAGVGSGSGGSDEYAGAKLRFQYSFSDRREKSEAAQIDFTYQKPDAAISFEYGYSWYDREGLIFSEAVQQSGVSNLNFVVSYPDYALWLQDVACGYIGNVRAAAYGNSVRMEYGNSKEEAATADENKNPASLVH